MYYSIEVEEKVYILYQIQLKLNDIKNRGTVDKWRFE